MTLSFNFGNFTCDIFKNIHTHKLVIAGLFLKNKGMILNLKTDAIFLMMSCVFCLFTLQVLENPDLEVFQFLMCLCWDILDGFSTWCIKHTIITMCPYVH